MIRWWSVIRRDARSIVVSRAVKPGAKGDSRQERCIRALCDEVSEKGEVMCFVIRRMRLA